MTCREFADFVMGYLDGQLDAETRRRFDEHLTLCPDCVHYLEQYRATVAVSAAAYADEALPDDVPESLVKAILDARKDH